MVTSELFGFFVPLPFNSFSLPTVKKARAATRVLPSLISDSPIRPTTLFSTPQDRDPHLEDDFGFLLYPVSRRPPKREYSPSVYRRFLRKTIVLFFFERLPPAKFFPLPDPPFELWRRSSPNWAKFFPLFPFQCRRFLFLWDQSPPFPGPFSPPFPMLLLFLLFVFSKSLVSGVLPPSQILLPF